MRKFHRFISYLFVPFLAVAALTGLLWAYAPHTYLKHAPDGHSAPVLDENRKYLQTADVIRAARAEAGGGKVTNVILRVESGKLLYVVNLATAKGPREIWVDAETGAAFAPVRTRTQEFHQWVMKLHKLNFFGTKKELTAIPGVGLLLLSLTGILLWRKRNV